MQAIFSLQRPYNYPDTNLSLQTAMNGTDWHTIRSARI